MCIIIDTNTFSSVFIKTSHNHEEFKPVLDWILYGKGKAIYGGTKYQKELTNAKRYLKFFRLLKDMGKTHKVADDKVDLLEKIIEDGFPSRGFNDQHLVALVIVSKCKLVCSSDSTSYEHLKNPILYPEGVERPKIYSGKRNTDLLCDLNLIPLCGPYDKLNKSASAKYLHAFDVISN